MRKRILLVDDMKTVIMVEKKMLASEDLEIHVATDGLEALECIKSSRPDIILMDMMMPNLDGVETCRRIKSVPETNSIPVILVTTPGEEDRVKAAFAAGCDDYVTKPINKLTLITKLRALLA